MSNKAIVFYTGELLEVQENSLREAHGVENIIFVPIENKDDLNTKILETTEQPFNTYNYLDDPDLVLALCDKMTNFTTSTGYDPKYYIWVEVSDVEQRKQVSKTKGIKPRVIVISEETLVRSLKLQLRKVDEKFEVTKLLIPELSEANVKHIFIDKIFRGQTSPTFVLIDDRHKYAKLIADLANEMNVYRNLLVRITDLRNQDLNGIIFDQANLEMRERLDKVVESKIRSAEAHYNKPGELHVDVSGIPMPDSIKAVKERVEKFKEMHSHTDIRTSMKDFDPNEPRPDPYLSYGEAIEMCKKGIDVACVNWRADEFLTITHAQIVPANQFWSPSNRRVAEAKPEKSLIVDNYFLRTNKYSTVPHQVCFADMFDEWMVASDRVKVKSVTVDTDDGLSKLTLHYALDTFTTPDFELAPFWIVYDVLAKLPQRVTVISDDPKSALPHIVGSMKEAHEHRQQIVEESYQFGEDGIDDNMYPHRGVDFVCNIGLNDILKSIEAGEFKDVILDNDSFKTDFVLEKIKEALQRTDANWVSVSVKEQLFGITE